VALHQLIAELYEQREKMKRQAPKIKLQHAIVAIGIGAAVMLLQDLAKAETESWMKRNRLWPS
jgi:hypothetical protein